MRVVEFQDVAEFAWRARPLLLEQEAVNSVILGIVGRHCVTSPSDVPRPLAYVVEADDGRVVAACVMTSPRPLLVTQATCSNAMAALADHMARAGVSVPSVAGPAVEAQEFARAWTARTGPPSRLGTALGAYQLDPRDLVPPPRPAAGSLRSASTGDAEQLADWADSFIAETGVPPTGEAARQSVDLLISERRLFVWCDPEPVSMAAQSLPTPNGVRINWVFTPVGRRRHGYASACVAALSRLLLDSGRRFCFLFTDLNFPTSNKIYRDLGYRHVGDCRRCDFGPLA